MKFKLFLFSFFVGTSAFAEMSDSEARLRRRAMDKVKFKVDNTDYCGNNTTKVKELQALISDQKSGDKKLFELENQYDAYRAEKVLIDGIQKLNTDYKKFLLDISNTGIPGLDADGKMSLGKLKQDLDSTKTHLDNVRVMAVIDHLLKGAIGNKDDLLDFDEEKGVINNNDSVSKSDKVSRDEIIDDQNNKSTNKNILKISNDSSGDDVFNKLVDSCSSNKSNLCKLIQSNDKAINKGKLKATVTGFVNAYRLASRNSLVRFGRGIFKDDLKDYREALLDGVKGNTPEEKGDSINKLIASIDKLSPGEKSPEEAKFYKEIEGLNKLASNENPLITELNVYENCLTKNALTGATANCALTEDKKGLVGSLTTYGNSQKKIVDGLGGTNNDILKAGMERVHEHNKNNTLLQAMEKAYKNEESIKKQIQKTIADNKEALEKATSQVFTDIQSQTNGVRNHMSLMNNKKFAIPTGAELKETNEKLNDKISEIFIGSCEDESCREAKDLNFNDSRDMFQLKDNKIALNPDKLDNFLDAVRNGSLTKGLDRKLNGTMNEDGSVKDKGLLKNMAETKAAIEEIRNSKNNKTLESLLAFYGNRSASVCQNDKNKSAQWKCLVDEAGDKNDKVYSLVDGTGDILARMPSSPQKLAITSLNSKCNTNFMTSFKDKEQAKQIEKMCNEIHKESEAYTAKLAPTPEEKIYPYTDRYWDGKQWQTEKRTRAHKAVIHSTLKSGLSILPWELNRRMQMTGVKSWESNTIEGIKYRNNMLSTYYSNYGITPGYYYGGGYFGGAIYNNNFNYSTVGTGGYFPLTTTTGTSTTSATSSGFEF